MPQEEIAAWARVEATAFLNNPEGEDAKHWIELIAAGWDPARVWGARDHGRWVGTLTSERRSLTVPGTGDRTRDLVVDALSGVSVAASHRRMGVMSRMVEDALRAARERGDALSALIPAEWPIYGRLGYGPATLTARYTLRRDRPGCSVAGDTTRVHQVVRDEFGEHAHKVFAAARARSPGQIDRSPEWWSERLSGTGYNPLGLPTVWLLHDGPAGPDGLLAWRAEGDPSLVPPRKRVHVWVLAAASDDAYRNLWAYLSGIDGADEVQLWSRPVDEPVRWLLRDARTLVTDQYVDMLWLRILDVPAALTARCYQAPGDLVLEVLDGHAGGYAAGRFRLAVDGGEVSCEPTRAAPDLEITERALASIYLGGYRLLPQRMAGAVVERTPGSLELVDRMFASAVTPWNATWF